MSDIQPAEAARLRVYSTARLRCAERLTRDWREALNWNKRGLVKITPTEIGWATVELTAAGREAVGA